MKSIEVQFAEITEALKESQPSLYTRVQEKIDARSVDGKKPSLEVQLNLVEKVIQESGYYVKDGQIKGPVRIHNGRVDYQNVELHETQRSQYQAYKACGISEREARIMAGLPAAETDSVATKAGLNAREASIFECHRRAGFTVEEALVAASDKWSQKATQAIGQRKSARDLILESLK